MKICGIIFARLDSSRLPNKALIYVEGRPIIGYVFHRARMVHGLSNIVLATSTRPIDNPLVSYAKEMNISVYRGSLNDIALRALKCALKYDADYFVRINGDSPFLDHQLVEDGIEYCREGYDFINNITERTYPYGISIEIIKTETYQKIYSRLKFPEDNEHITQFFYRHPNEFNIKNLICKNEQIFPYRMVIDNYQDLKRFKKVVQIAKDKALTGNYEEIAEYYKCLTLKNIG